MIIEYTIKQLINSKIHLGHHYKRWNPEIINYIIGIREQIHIINLNQTLLMLKKVIEVLAYSHFKKKPILYLNQNYFANKIIKKLINEYDPEFKNNYLAKYWISGSLTNINQIKLTKKDYLQPYIKNIRIPNITFIYNTEKSYKAIKECKKLKIPTIAIIDTTNTPLNITYPIPGNDDSIESLRLYTNIILNTIYTGRLLNASYFQLINKKILSSKKNKFYKLLIKQKKPITHIIKNKLQIKNLKIQLKKS